MSVTVDDRTVYEPDALVRCGAAPPGNAVEVSDPSSWSRWSPRRAGEWTGASKLAGYFSLPSVRHYLIVDVDKHVVIHHRRDGRGEIGGRIVHDGLLELDPPGLAIEVRDVFDGL